MAAYAAVTSLMQILDQLERHPSPPITLHKQQVQSLTQILTSLQEFLECYNSPFSYSDEADPSEMRIADAAYAVEDVIESYIVDAIHIQKSRSTHHPSWSRSWFFNCFSVNNNEAASHECGGEEVRRWNKFYQDVERVIKDMDLIKKEVMREKSSAAAHQLPERNIFRSSSLTVKNNRSIMMIGFDDAMLQLLDKLTGGRRSRQVIPITGMGGIGKTTLARNLFENALVKEYFDICAWVTFSQQFSTREIICEILSQISGQKSEGKSEEELREKLYKYLFGRRYLIVMDDIWGIDAWEEMRSVFGDCNNGSRVIVTTRQSYLTCQLTDDSNYCLDMKFLDEVSSWDLFSNTIFGDEGFPLPLELEKIGKKIVERCRGLPLSISVIGGLLAKSDHTQEYWEHIEQKLSSIVNSENDEYCRNLLKLSYSHLPAYLQPCFLYMGTFKEDEQIRVSRVVKLWVSEGFLKPENGKSLETIGKKFFKDLIDRNLILIDRLGSTGNIKQCKMHDLLRDLCLKEAEKERFYQVIGQHQHSTPPQSDQGLIPNQRRIIYNGRRMRSSNLKKSMSSRVRSLTFNDGRAVVFPDSRELRILNAAYIFSTTPTEFLPLQDVIDKLVNSRYLAIWIHSSTKLSLSVSFLWNLHTLRIKAEEGGNIVAPVEIWKMSQLRHVEVEFDLTTCRVYLPDPPPSGSSVVILENLETLKGVVNFKCGEEVVKRIPNIKRLKVEYNELNVRDQTGDYYCLNNLECLRKLESLTCNKYDWGVFLPPYNITFPHSLKKLTLGTSSGLVNSVGWEELLENIGLLPLLQKLILNGGVFKTGKWETVEGRFPNLRYFKMRRCGGLEQWTMTESSHFPCLEHLCLHGLHGSLVEIPAAIGEIPTLQSIELFECNQSVLKSAKKIVEEQGELQGEDQLSFHVKLLVWGTIALQSLVGPNFKLELIGKNVSAEMYLDH